MASRPALHTLLRGFRAEAQPDRYAEVVSALETMRQLVDSVHSGSRLGFSGLPFKQVVNIGIGGSDFGPRLMCRALRMPTDPLKAHFVANVDPQDIDEILAQLHPGETLFIVCSKSFSTEETLTNALRARDWLLAAGARPPVACDACGLYKGSSGEREQATAGRRRRRSRRLHLPLRKKAQ